MLISEPFLASPPQRIVSLVPSQTEFLLDLGLAQRIVGRTKFCIHPAEECPKITKVGGTKKFNFDLIDKLAPDLIIGNKEENYQEGIAILAQKYPVWISDIYTFAQALEAMQAIGNLVHKPTEAQAWVERISKIFAQLIEKQTLTPKHVAYFIWHKPMMVAAANTFIHDMLQVAGFKNVFAHLERYPAISPEVLQNANVDYIFLSSEPYPFKQKDIDYFQAIAPQAQALLVDGEMFSWYGSRLYQSAMYFQKLRQELHLF